MIKFIYSGFPKKIAKVITEKFPEISYSKTMKLIREKQILINGKRIVSDVLTNDKDEVICFCTLSFKPRIIYEDSNIIIAFKPKGMLTEEEFTEKLKLFKNDSNIEPCHRLDRNTDGLLIFSKNKEAKDEIIKAFKENRVKKIYRALVHGKLKEDNVVATAYLLKNPKLSKVKIFDNPVKGSVKIITEYKIIERKGTNTLIEIILHTGKTHQIRAYFAYIGHFILGDGKYGNEEINRREKYKKQQLTAVKLSFEFPIESKLNYLNKKNFEIN